MVRKILLTLFIMLIIGISVVGFTQTDTTDEIINEEDTTNEIKL
ncbi:hypothetical protein [Ornithinibacillus halophilus]|uniref:Uncharacterized protein n=1 Tax=Ornithinibacillus halophilus TaxID=930117 RepID=A0A1M5ID14_9BACI|nr:hypothetical protein [Ornithinibacillus halophilus]SHG25653.1 hypothetical protein SAMN05216225_10234 [Ornithinibacillus halophilus]